MPQIDEPLMIGTSPLYLTNLERGDRWRGHVTSQCKPSRLVATDEDVTWPTLIKKIIRRRDLYLDWARTQIDETRVLATDEQVTWLRNLNTSRLHLTKLECGDWWRCHLTHVIKYLIRRLMYLIKCLIRRRDLYLAHTHKLTKPVWSPLDSGAATDEDVTWCT